MLTDAANTAAPLILLGMDAGSLAGYSGTDPALDGRGLARLVRAGEARYVVARRRVLHARRQRRDRGRAARLRVRCRPSAWQNPAASPSASSLFDCAGRERGLASCAADPGRSQAATESSR